MELNTAIPPQIEATGRGRGRDKSLNPYPREGIHWIWLIWLNLVNWILGKGINGVG